MENNDNIVMSRIAFERMQAKDERNDKWRNIIIILLIVLLALTNGAWLWAWNSYEYVVDDYSIEAEQDGGGINIVGGGDIAYGSESSNNSENSNEAKS